MSQLARSLPSTCTEERSRRLSVDALRHRALERLYERRAAVDELIQSLERYQEAQNSRRAPVIDFTVAAKLWSDSAR